MQLKLKRGVFSHANDINLFLMKFSRISLHSKLVPVHYREHEYAYLFRLSTLVTPQAAQTLFVIYIRDSIALRFKPFKENV